MGLTTASIPADMGGLVIIRSNLTPPTGSYRLPCLTVAFTPLRFVLDSARETARLFKSVIQTWRTGLSLATTIPITPMPQPRSRTLPFSGSVIDSISRRVPESTRLWLKTPELVSNSNSKPLSLVLMRPLFSGVVGFSEK